MPEPADKHRAPYLLFFFLHFYQPLRHPTLPTLRNYIVSPEGAAAVYIPRRLEKPPSKFSNKFLCPPAVHLQRTTGIALLCGHSARCRISPDISTAGLSMISVAIGSSSRRSPPAGWNVCARLTVTRNLIRRNGNALSRFSCAAHVFLLRPVDPRRIGGCCSLGRHAARGRANLLTSELEDVLPAQSLPAKRNWELEVL